MAQQVFPPKTIVDVILEGYLKHRGLVHAGRMGADIPSFTADRIISDMEQFSYVRIDAHLPDAATRDWVIIMVLGGSKKKYYHSGDLRTLLQGVASEKVFKSGRLKELIIIAEDVFFTKKNLTDVVSEIKAKFEGVECNAHPYCNFACIIPEHKSVPKHRIMSDAEVEALLTRERLLKTDLPVILTTDPAVVWLNAHEGQVIEITRDSHITVTSINYRLVK